MPSAAVFARVAGRRRVGRIAAGVPLLALAGLALLGAPNQCAARHAPETPAQAALEKRWRTTQCLAPEARAQGLAALAQSMLREAPAEAWLGDPLLADAVNVVVRFHPLLSDTALAGLRDVIGPLREKAAAGLTARYAGRPDLAASVGQDEARQMARLDDVLDLANAARHGEAALADWCRERGCATSPRREAALASAPPDRLGLGADGDALARTTREFAARPPAERAAFVLDVLVDAARRGADRYAARALVQHAILLLRSLDPERSDAALAALARADAFLLEHGVPAAAATAFASQGRLGDSAHFARLLAGRVRADAREVDAFARYAPCWNLVPRAP